MTWSLEASLNLLVLSAGVVIVLLAILVEIAAANATTLPVSRGVIRLLTVAAIAAALLSPLMAGILPWLL